MAIHIWAWPRLLWGYIKTRRRSTAAALTRGEAAAWWLQVVGSGPWRRPQPCRRAFSAVGPSGKGWSPAERASGRPLPGCTPAREPLPHSGGPGSRSDTRRYAADCRSRGSGRGAGSQLRKEQQMDISFSAGHGRTCPLLVRRSSPIKKPKFLPDLNSGAHFKLIESRGHYFHFSALFCPFRSAVSLGGAVTLNFA